ncbi:hypothetical protein ACTQ49_01795 [Luteococcus sp. Sow4_B9]|uniref:hypothetical protein n=1 Tax=Luteococcus sp. Sow4_B9 TaxID=3438792 RepID=UPI003F9582CC
MTARSLVPLAIAGLLLAGCSSSPGASAPSPSLSAVSAPAGGAALRQLGLVHGPQDFWLPAQIEVTSQIDQPNVVTLTMPTAQRALLVGWLQQELPPGWTVDGASDDSVLFHGGQWQGAFTCSTTTCAVTLRHQAGPA